MIVFPVLNFVLPLMLTSFLIVSPNSCIECNHKIVQKNEQSYEIVKNKTKYSESELKDLKNSKNYFKNKNVNVY